MRAPRRTLRALLLAPLLLLASPAAGAAEMPAEPTPPLVAEPFFYALSVADADASAAWYGRVLGLEVERSVDLAERGIRIRLLRGGAGLVELVESAASRPLEDVGPELGSRHEIHGVYKIGFRVADLAAAQARLEALGIALRGRAVTEQDGSMRSLQILDPDGTIVQLFEILAVGGANSDPAGGDSDEESDQSFNPESPLLRRSPLARTRPSLRRRMVALY